MTSNNDNNSNNNYDAYPDQGPKNISKGIPKFGFCVNDHSI